MASQTRRLLDALQKIIAMRALLVFNPTAGSQGPRRHLPAAIAILEQGGWEVDIARTHDAGHSSELARQAGGEGYQVVIAAGGDGTINQIAGGLALAQADGLPIAALGILPAGTGNVLARDLGLPVPMPGVTNTLEAAARLLLRSEARWVDIGRAHNGEETRTFMCWLGVGLDAAITADVMANPELKRRFGALFFITSAVAHVPTIRRAPVYTVSVDGHAWNGRAVLAVVSNIPSYAVVLDMAPTALINDGLLDVTLFQNVNLVNGLEKLLKVLGGVHLDDPDVIYAKGTSISIHTSGPQAVHVDAEPFGTTPVTVKVISSALQLLVPPRQAAQRIVPF